MRRTLSIGLISIAILMLFTLLMNRPSEPIAIIEDGQSIQSINVNGQKFADEQIVDEMIELLQQFSAVETDNPFPMETDKIALEIDFLDHHQPRHILLGEINILYGSADEEVYRIINGEQLQLEMEKYLQ